MQYQAPANDLRFLLFDVLGADKLHELEKHADATPDLISAVIDEAGNLGADPQIAEVVDGEVVLRKLSEITE